MGHSPPISWPAGFGEKQRKGARKKSTRRYLQKRKKPAGKEFHGWLHDSGLVKLQTGWR